MGQLGSARFSFNRSGPGLQPDTTARTSPQHTVKGSRPDSQHEMRPTVFGALLGQTSTGLPCSASLRNDRGGRLLYAGATVVCTQGRRESPFHVRPSTTVSSIVSVAPNDDAFRKGSRLFALPIFALPWVR